MKTTEQFLSELCSLNIKLWVENDRLRCSAPKETLTSDIKAELTTRKPEILAYFSRANQALKSNSLAILPASHQGNIPLSYAQQRLWFLNQLEPNSSSYNLPAAVKLTGKLNVAVLSQSIQTIIKRHEILRTTFTVVDAEAIQVIGTGKNFYLPVIDLQDMEEKRQLQELENLAVLVARKPFNLEQDLLIRTSLIQLSATEYIILLTMHHIVSDGWSIGIFIKELTTLYTAFAQGQTSPLPELSIQYADFAIWQRKWLQGEVLKKQLNYWKQQLSGNLPILELPTDKPRPAIQSHHGAKQFFQLSQSLTKKLKNLCQQEGSTLFMTLLAAFKVLLYRYTQQEDIIVGTPIANRNRVEIEGLIGCFVNTLALRTNLGNNPTFRKLLKQVREVTLGAYAHQDLPFEKLVEELQVKRDLTHNPLFQVMFILQNTPAEVIELPELNLEILKAEKNTANFDLNLSLTEIKSGIQGELEYNTDIFNPDRISRMIGHFQVLLEGVVSNPEECISTLPLLTTNEQHQLLTEWNQTEVNYPQEQCIHQLFETQVEKTPDAVAVVFENQQLTYRELNNKANQLAHYLQKLGVKPEVLVGICVERSLEMVIGLLAILKAGGAYVPLDPNLPQERLAWMMEDSQISVLLTQENLLTTIPFHCTQVIYLDKDWEKIFTYPQNFINSRFNPNHLSYTIYTSGSTGKPKGVQITHRNVVNFLTGMQRKLQLSNNDSLLSVTTLSFDIAGLEIFLPLTTGSKLILVSREIATDGHKLIKQINNSAVTIMQATPATWRMLLDANWTGNQQLKILCGGESLPKSLANKLLSKCQQLWNLYGPTETTIWSTMSQIDDTQKPITIGRPIANTQIYILDEHLQPLPVGVPGELHIGGVGLAKGYLNRPELTNQKFIPHPFNPQKFIYKTGDLACYLANGEIEYLGRIDHQVKIRGFRIELGEIEAVLNQHPKIKEVVVIVREDRPEDKRLVAYYIPQSVDISGLEIKNFIKPQLPDYMIPSAFVVVDNFPLTPNGKIDRRALPAPDLSARDLNVNYLPPRTPMEEIIANIWSKILGVEQIGVNNNFFELGGHSLLATQLISRIRQDLQIELPLQKIFEFPTIAELATEIETIQSVANSLVSPPILPVSRENHLPLSFAQQRLWFIEQLQSDNPAYNITSAVRVQGNLNITALESCFQAIISRHESLRTGFSTVEGLPIQVISENLQFSLPVIDLQTLSKSEQETQIQQFINQETQQTFDLTQVPLLRVIILQLSSTEYVVIFTMHHIISDAWSTAVIIREIVALYPTFAEGKSLTLPELPIQYADFAIWQRQWLQGQVLENHLAYWKQKLGAALPVLKLPYKQNQTATPSNKAGIQPFSLSPELSQAINKISRQENVTLFMTMVAALKTLLYRCTGQDDIVIGTDVANRNRGETESLIGFFVNLLVLRTDISGYPTFRELLQRVRKVTLEAYNHQDLPFDKLVEELQPERQLSNTPLFQVLFVMDNVPTQNLQLPGLTLSPIKVESRTAKFDIALFMSETETGITGSWLYKQDLFVTEKITGLFDNFHVLLNALVNQPDARINTLDLRTETQKQEQLQIEVKNEQGKLKKLMKVKPKAMKLSD
jgi:amino acid adenylation domain-containing protein